MGAELKKFSKSLSREDFDEVLKYRKEITENPKYKGAGFEVPELKLDSVKVFENQFTFPQIAKNDFAQE